MEMYVSQGVNDKKELRDLADYLVGLVREAVTKGKANETEKENV